MMCCTPMCDLMVSSFKAQGGSHSSFSVSPLFVFIFVIPAFHQFVCTMTVAAAAHSTNLFDGNNNLHLFVYLFGGASSLLKQVVTFV